MSKAEDDKGVFREYCEHTTLHGWIYVIESNKKRLQQLFWLALIIIFNVLALVIVINSIIDWENEPTITTIKNYSANVADVQFPTITVCPKDFPNDRWAFSRALLDEIDFPCDPEGDEDCEKILEKFDFYLRKHYDHFTALLEANFAQAPGAMDYPDDFDIALSWIVSAQLDTNEIAENFTYHFGRSIGGDAVHFNKTIAELRRVSETSSSNPLPRMTEVLACYHNGTNCTSDIDDTIKYTMQLIIMKRGWSDIRPMDNGIGTLMSEFSRDVIGGTFAQMRADMISKYYWNQQVDAEPLSADDIELYALLQELQKPFVPELGDLISPMDIPAIFSQSVWPAQEWAMEWFRYYHYSAKKIQAELNKTVHWAPASFFDESLPQEVTNPLGEILGPYRDFVVRVMLLASTVADPYPRAKSTFKLLFGDTRTGLKERKDEDPFRWQYKGYNFDWPTDPLRMYVMPNFWSVYLNQTVASTDNGVCTVVNGLPSKTLSEEAYMRSPLLQALKDVYPETNFTIRNNSGSGYANAFVAVMVGSRVKQVEDEAKKARRFQVSFNQNNDFMSNRHAGVEAIPGAKTIVTVTPVARVTTASFKELPIEQRRCRYPEEIPTDMKIMFKTYTQRSCQFLCMIRKLSKNDKIDCVPWDMPTLGSEIDNGDEKNICDGYVSMGYDWEATMYNSDRDPECDCVPDCEGVTFETEVMSVPFKEEFDCDISQQEKYQGSPVQTSGVSEVL